LLVMGGAIAESGDRTLAQIAPDDTLGAESSVVTPTTINGIPSDRISGGAIRGANLFHSFEKFSVPTGSAAYFNNALDIQNIISRVTGESISNIDGLLRSNGTANLFLLNPNGIIFGPNASLNIGGSFLASTASTINFADGTQFSATAHPTTPLLTVSVPIGLQYEGNAGSIRNQSQATNSSSETVGLQVPPSKTLALVGGNVSLDGGNLQAPGGRVELGGVSGAGTLRLSVDRDNLGLSFPVGGQIADVFLTNGADVYVSDSGGGSIAINARNLNVLGGSKLRAGIASGLGSVDAQAGDITLNAQQAITIANNSLISNAVLPRAVGNSGDINIKTGSFSVTEGAFLTASTFGQGDAGSVTIQASDTVSFDREGSNGFSSSAFSRVEQGAVGKGGDINIRTRSLSVTNGAFLDASTSGQGDAGRVFVQANDAVYLAGNDANIFSNVKAGGVGNGGEIRIKAGSLSLINGAQIQTLVRQADEDGKLAAGQGNAGNVNIDVSDTVTIAGVNSSNGFPSKVTNQVESGASGNGGTISITAGSLSITDGARLSASTFGQGNAGDILIDARDQVSLNNGASIRNNGEQGDGGDIPITTRVLLVDNGALLGTYTSGQGDAGDVLIDAQDRVSLDNGVITNQVGKRATGNGGDIRISTGSLTATNIGLLQAFTIGRGNAGSIIIKARDLVVFQGASEDGPLRSGAVSIAGDGAAGSGGNVEITTRSVAIIDRASVSASTKGQGNAGNVIIHALENISLDNSSTIFSAVEKNAEGRGGNINITTGSLSLTNGGQLDASTFGQNNSGNIIVTARDTISLDGISPNKAENASTIFTEVFKDAQGDGGNIQISTGSLLVTNEGQLDAKTRGRGNAGNIFITARDTVLFDGTSVTGKRSARALSRVDQGAEGSGGNIEITTGSLTLNNGAQLLANTLGKGDAGSVIVNARDSVTFDGSRTDTDGQSPSAAFSSVDEGGVGNGGNVQIAARSLSVTNGARLSAESRGQGDAGSLEVMADSIRLSNQASLIANTTAGQGNIILRSGDLVLRRGSNITTNATGTGTGGNITIDTGVLAALENSDISANAQDARGGRVIIDAQGIFGTDFRENLTPQSDITASSKLGPQFSGTVEINTPDVDPSQGLVTLPAELVDASGVIASGCGSGGRQGESRFIVTGRGGLPIRPQDAYISPYPTGTVRSIPSSGPSSETPLSSVEGNDPSTNPIIAAPTQIVEARGWVINASGEVVLTASASTVNPNIPSMTPAKCHAPETSS
jgi:filamentous hemagglutinin family protein